MKRILCLIALLIIIATSYSQVGNFRDLRVRESIRLGDSTVTIIGSDTLTNPAMVRQLISEGSGYTASNGITKVGSDFQTGGTLTKNTWYNGNSYDFNIGQPASQVNNFDVWSSGNATITSDIFKISMPSYEWTFDGLNITGSDADYLVKNSRLLSYVSSQEKSSPFIFLYENQGVTANQRPGVGFYSTNSATASLITQIYIDDYDQNSVDKHNFIQLADTGSYFYIQQKGITTAYYMYQIESFADSSGWTVYNVYYKFSTGTITVTDNIELVLEINNNVGGYSGTVDTFYVAGQNEWIFSGDTIRKIDTSNYSFLSNLSDSSTISDSSRVAAYAYNSDSNFVTIIADTGYINNIYSDNGFKVDGDSINLSDLTVRFGSQIANKEYTSGNNFSYVALPDAYAALAHGASNLRSQFLADAGYAIMEAVNTAGDAYRYKIYENTAYLILNGNDTIYKFNTDSLKAPDVIAEFKEVNVEKLISDTNIINGDTITGGISLKDAVESEQFAQINFKDTTFTAQSDGRLFYNENTKNLIFENDISDFEHNIGYELVKRVYNNSGSTITNGSIVRRTGTYVNGSRVPTVGLAGNGSADSSRVCGMATVDIPNNSYGIITIIGDVNFYNSSHLAENQFYLGHAGSTIDTSPPPPYYSVDLGCVIYSDNDSGIVAFNFRNPTFDPTPIISSDTSGWLKLVSVTQNIYTKFQISDFDLENDYGFTRLGDSIRCDVGGFVTIVMNTSYTGAVTSATWRKGIFLNGVNKHSVSRSTTSQAVGNSTVIKTLRVEVNDYISFRITNTTGNEDPTINDFSYQILYLHE